MSYLKFHHLKNLNSVNQAQMSRTEDVQRSRCTSSLPCKANLLLGTGHVKWWVGWSEVPSHSDLNIPTDFLLLFEFFSEEVSKLLKPSKGKQYK